MMAVGRVVKFDESRGFGFIAPVGGREDVFLHVNDLLIPEALVRPGAMLKFDIDEGDRGLKASNIELPEDDGGSTAPGHVELATPVASSLHTVGTAGRLAGTAGSPAVAGTVGDPGTIVAPVRRSAVDGDSEEFCDLLTADELSGQLTELLLSAVPPLTGDQILNVRIRLTEFAKDCGWLAP